MVSENVEEIVLNLPQSGSVSLKGEDKNEFLLLFKAANFESSNRLGHGPTPDGNFTFVFEDQEVSVRYLVGANGISPRFELSPRHIDPNTQFYVESEAVAEMLEKYIP